MRATKIRLKIDKETRGAWRAAERARKEVASWPAWKRGVGLTDDQARSILGSCTTLRIDRERVSVLQSPAAETVHHVIVRADLSVGQMAAQILHAAGESAWPRPLPGTIAVALAARDELHLRVIQSRLHEAEIEHHCVFEGDGPHAGQMMSVGVMPTTDRAAVRKVLSSLPLVK